MAKVAGMLRLGKGCAKEDTTSTASELPCARMVWYNTWQVTTAVRKRRANRWGTTSLVLDEAGDVVAEARHSPYGEERWSSGTLPTDYRFTGQRHDGYIKLVQMRARWYDYQLGRWISPDTLVPDLANPQSFNRFSYVYNNPLRFVDPTGMFTEEELVEWGAYTWEQIEALRGSEWYAVLMEAQLGDSVYFGNGIADYTGPMGMGTFYMSEPVFRTLPTE
ncbi:MAG: RHS repeat-associated core domain-containing protein [Chloroflexi bacterium]|nr:RHS repeat-associated core domain-containing protein [Chloroflexota bacterium]